MDGNDHRCQVPEVPIVEPGRRELEYNSREFYRESCTSGWSVPGMVLNGRK